MSDSIAIIDAHAQLGSEHPFALTADDLLRRMDAAGVAMALARPMGTELVADNHAGNDRVLSAGPRIRGLATVNPWLGAPALDELTRCRDRGAVGLFLHPSRQGFMPIEPIAAPVIERAASFGWPIMFHTGTYVQSDVLAIAELARRFPAVTFIMGWGGFTDMWFELPGVMGEVPNLIIEAGMIWSAAVIDIVKLYGPQRVLFAGGEPRNRYASVLRALDRWELTPEQRRAILHDNAARLFGVSAVLEPSPSGSGQGEGSAIREIRPAIVTQGSKIPRPNPLPKGEGVRRLIDFHTHLADRWFHVHTVDEDTFRVGLEANGVDAACVFTLMGFYEPTRPHNQHLADRARAHPKMFIPFVTVDPKVGMPAVRELEEFLTGPAGGGFFRGVKFHGWCQSFASSMVRDTMIEVLKIAAACRVPVLYHDGTPPYTTSFQIAAVARWVPEATIVLGHAGLADYVVAAGQLARDLPNVYACLCCPKAGDLQYLIDTAGPDKVLWGSDCGIGDMRILPERLDDVLSAKLDADTQDRVLYRNSARLLHLDERPL